MAKNPKKLAFGKKPIFFLEFQRKDFSSRATFQLFIKGKYPKVVIVETKLPNIGKLIKIGLVLTQVATTALYSKKRFRSNPLLFSM